MALEGRNKVRNVVGWHENSREKGQDSQLSPRDEPWYAKDTFQAFLYETVSKTDFRLNVNWQLGDVYKDTDTQRRSKHKQ